MRRRRIDDERSGNARGRDFRLRAIICCRSEGVRGGAGAGAQTEDRDERTPGARLSKTQVDRANQAATSFP